MSCDCDHPSDSCPKCAGDGGLAQQLEEAINATRTADHDPRIGRLVAGRVEKAATLEIRSARAAANEKAVDIEAAEDVIDPRSARPLGPRSENLPQTEASTRILVVSIMVDVPIVANREATNDECVMLAMRHLWQQSPCVHFNDATNVWVEDVQHKGDDFPAAIKDEARAQALAMYEAIRRANAKQQEADDEDEERGHREDQDARDDSHRFFKGGGQ